MNSSIKTNFLTSVMIQNYVGLANFQKGMSYTHQQAIKQGKLKNYLLTAKCQGNEFDPYRVEVIFTHSGIDHSYCSCPVGAGGKCKHVAALLIRWLEHSEEFVIWNDLKSHLQHYDAQTLIELIELIDLLEEHSETSDEVIQAFQKNLQTVHSPQLARFFRRIEEAFHVTRLPWYHPDNGGLTEISFALGKIRSETQQLLEHHEVDDVIRITHTLIQQILNYLDDHQDSWGSLSEELKGCVHILDQAFAQVETADKRQKILQILFRLVEEQLHRDIYRAANEAKQVILNHAQADEKQKVISWLHALLANQGEQEQAPQGIEDFLIDLQKETLEPKVYLEHYRHTGQVLKLVDSLLELHEVAEAKQVAKQKEFISQTLALAQLFVKHHQKSFAEKLVLDFVKQRPDLQSYRWLKEFYQLQNKIPQALQQAKQMLYLSPQFAYYQNIQEMAQQIHQWPIWREEIINYLKDQQHDLLLVEIYLDEKELDQAIEALEDASRNRPQAYKNTYYGLLALQVAAAARYKYPLVSLQIYEETVKELIEERNRESYQKACDYLKIIRSIYQDLTQQKEWELYLKTLLQTYRRLRALQEEISRAHLI
jgi:uncharacterized Zn finger protein